MRIHSDVVSALAVLGESVSVARRRRRWTMAQAAARAGVARGTWARIEHGRAEVSLGVLARALDALGLLEQFAEVVEPGRDRVGIELDVERLPARVRRRRGER